MMTYERPGGEPYRISTFSSVADIVPRHIEFSAFRDIAAWIQQSATSRAERDGPTISGAEYLEGGTRRDAHVHRVHLLFVDIDDHLNDEVEAFIDDLEEWGIAYCCHDTWRHDPDSDCGRYRVVIPLSRPVTVDEYRKLVPRAWPSLDIEDLVDSQCEPPSHAFLLPAAPLGRTPEVGFVDGAPLDVDFVLAWALPPEDEKPFEPYMPVPEEERGEITEGLRTKWRQKVQALCDEIRARPYPGPFYDLKNDRVFGLAQGVPHIIEREELRIAVIAALAERNPQRDYDELAHFKTAVEQVEKAIDDGMGQPWWPRRTRFPLTDSGNAERMLRRFGDRIRYVTTWGDFVVYDEQVGVWRHDAGNELVFAMTKDIARSATSEFEDADGDVLKSARAFAKYSESSKGRKAMVACLKGEPSILTDHESFDADPWLLNVRNGVVDLRTGQLRPHDPTLLLMKQSRVAFVPSATCPAFDRFLREVCCGDLDLEDYLLRALGYSLTGSIREHCMFLAHGGGRNGKSTLLNIMHEVLGDYATTAAPTLLLSTQQDQHPTEKADLYGARFCSANEVEEGRSLAEAEVKQLTGGDLIKARRMRENFWSFMPTHKLWLAANSLPRVRGMDEAIWSRLRVIPFDASFLGREDRDLPAKLSAEKAGILSRLVAGTQAWLQRGLDDVPMRVIQATAAYRRDQNALLEFLLEHYELDPALPLPLGAASLEASRTSEYRTPRSDLWRKYRAWSADQGSAAFTSTRGLNGALRRVFHEWKSGDERYFGGLRPKAVAMAAWSGPDGGQGGGPFGRG